MKRFSLNSRSSFLFSYKNGNILKNGSFILLQSRKCYICMCLYVYYIRSICIIYICMCLYVYYIICTLCTYIYIYIHILYIYILYIYIYLLYSILFEKETCYCLHLLHIYFCFMPYLFQHQVVLTGHNEIHSGFNKLWNTLGKVLFLQHIIDLAQAGGFDKLQIILGKVFVFFST